MMNNNGSECKSQGRLQSSQLETSEVYYIIQAKNNKRHIENMDITKNKLIKVACDRDTITVKSFTILHESG